MPHPEHTNLPGIHPYSRGLMSETWQCHVSTLGFLHFLRAEGKFRGSVPSKPRPALAGLQPPERIEGEVVP